MAIKESEFINNLHDRIGSVRDDEFSDGEARKALGEALRIYGRFLPQIVIDSVTTVADQQLYVLEIPELLNIRDVFWSRETDNETFNVFCNNGIPYQPFNGIARQSEWYGYIQMKKRQQRIDGYGYRFANFNELYLIPAPSTDGVSVFFEYERAHTLATIHEGHMDILLDLGEWYAKKVIGEKRRKTAAVTRSGNLQAPNSARTTDMIREAQEAKQRAEEELSYLRMRSDV